MRCDRCSPNHTRCTRLVHGTAERQACTTQAAEGELTRRAEDAEGEVKLLCTQLAKVGVKLETQQAESEERQASLQRQHAAALRECQLVTSALEASQAAALAR